MYNISKSLLSSAVAHECFAIQWTISHEIQGKQTRWSQPDRLFVNRNPYFD